jgi:hypothetical protein
VVMGKIVPGANYRSIIARVASSAEPRPRKLVIRPGPTALCPQG